MNQRPRGSLPPERLDGLPITHAGRVLVEDEPRLVTGEHDMLTRVLAIESDAWEQGFLAANDAVAKRAGGSLTATEPPDLPLQRTWCGVCGQRIPSTAQLHRHDESGSPRGVTPALDVERLAQASHARCVAQWEEDRKNDPDRMLTQHGWDAHVPAARKDAAEYARLGSPDQEDS